MTNKQKHVTQPVIVTLDHISGQYSDPFGEHKHDYTRIFDFAEAHDTWLLQGTEAGNWAAAHGAHLLAKQAAVAHGWHGVFPDAGDWIAVNPKFARIIARGYIPVIPATHGLPASKGGHGPRGIPWVTIEAKEHNLGEISSATGHWLTQNSIHGTGVTNAPMIQAVGDWGVQYGAATGIALYSCDGNEDDLRGNPLAPTGFTSLADALGKHPATHGVDKHHGSRIDYIASRNADGRVEPHDYRVLDDHDLHLYFDHFYSRGMFAVRPLHAA